MIQFLKTFARVFNRNLHKFLKQKIQSKNCEILLTTGIPSYHLNATIAIYLLHALYRKKIPPSFDRGGVIYSISSINSASITRESDFSL